MRAGLDIARRLVLVGPANPRHADLCADRDILEPVVRDVTAAFGSAHYHLGKDLRHIHQTKEDITAQFAVRSAVRTRLLPAARPLEAGEVAWRGLAEEAALRLLLPGVIFRSLAFCLPPGEQFLGYPVAAGNDLREGHRSWNVEWYRSADEATQVPRLLTDEAGRARALDPTNRSWRALWWPRCAAAAEHLPPVPRSARVRLIAQPFLQPI